MNARAVESSDSPTPTLQQNTQAAQQRVDQWEEEDQRQNRRASWELPLGVALLISGAAFATRSYTYAYAVSFAAGTG
ncbi:MAG TPA: hypothetical protein VMU17_03500, partial [Elusimicrobiota bacterium]|nr:hypothetical protein [Elusimicrobiota bacterium]